MNEQQLDRSMGLRRLFLETADERPAEGQLAAVLQLTSSVGQRAGWQSHLPWLTRTAPADRVVPVRYGWLATALLLSLALGAFVAGGGARGLFGNSGPATVPSTPFEGSWISTDPGDNSSQLLEVAAGPFPDVAFEDDFSMFCERNGDASTVWRSSGYGTISGNRLTVQSPDGGCSAWRVGPYLSWYDYDPASDHLTDYQGVEWERAP